MGGWQPDVAGVGPTDGLPAAGVILSSTGGTATLTNDGSIGALSDRAVASSPLFPSNNTSIINNGTITGFVQLVGGNNSISTMALFNLRHFADTTGGGSRYVAGRGFRPWHRPSTLHQQRNAGVAGRSRRDRRSTAPDNICRSD